MVKPGGRMVYSTCTFNAVENEGVVERFLRAHPDFSLTPFCLNGLPPTDGVMRFFPHRARGEGHFAALMTKSPDADGRGAAVCVPLPAPDGKEAAAARDFLMDFLVSPVAPNAAFASSLVHAPETPPLQGIKVLRAGLHLGQVKNHLFTPDHALAMARACRHNHPLTLSQARAYLHGDTLPCGEDIHGWLALSHQGLQIGIGKASNGQIKNHYPKGLRK